ncbi:MAG: adenosine deaminase [Flavobacteriales bacterium CG03_land_8_20_14_0_80_35_15]|nr:adenosine deaminase [Zetaproteobacteria bacterium]OIO13361.1 MAG: adenosine deaminase [Flavobacteriaceae bacterium CG1_02_35_72]PIV19480.1 MAG: adenosine deaminase [Flavobacteriales bacterium CG03_land_8_20_14_0_80_35_15]PJA06838.1 MAG: adenosine deaminase [Flavobacteriales bacterium CG_4_10_14_0_2_um_filter_35_18]
MVMKKFIQNLPKAELHLHIEGTFEPALMFEIAQRNQIKIPFKSVKEVEEAYKFSCLQDFLDIYYQGAQVLIKEQDFYDLTYAYLKKCAAQNVRHTEIMFDPQTHTDRGISFETVITGISRACADAKSKLGVSSLLIMSFLRHLSEEQAFKTLEQSFAFRHLITAVGLDSSEKGNPPSKFVKVYKASVNMGYIPLAHAGEEGDASYVWEALNLLKIKRIDHGNNALQDPKLVQEIIKRDMALTVCPLSNTALKVVENLKDHPLKKMMDLGLKVTINSDDPAYFGGQINQNYVEIQKALSLTKDDLYLLAKNSFEYSLLARSEKEFFKAELELYYQSN